MPSQRRLTTLHQSAVPQFRRAIPADLQKLFGRLELGGSLHTCEKAEAKPTAVIRGQGYNPAPLFGRQMRIIRPTHAVEGRRQG